MHRKTEALQDTAPAFGVATIEEALELRQVNTIRNVSVGDLVELWGKQVAVNEAADHCGTIGYELLTQVTSRVPCAY